ncbi:hypothetical protein CPHO_01120 [Corynebacterium phocae]|uniref:Nudix hydrolase domain-containing protein n=1 Tax=Corynebacterium phocae TaxID=161895 RepID=A0A1L7D145_9CORY|nr:CoA pyrophosphatase [Corynebacterium phocae]APT91752.1 hypothetical protein CPHO_01120 [Corynebacterium phocae]KAA8728516.1 CoA pyrophosphatase [Corynebacterium phocae]
MIPRWLDFPRVGAREGSPSSAVLMLLLGTEVADGRVVLTHRSPSMRSHSGQIAFPGGHLEPGETAADAALREAHEETGLDRRTVTVFDQWKPRPTMATGRWVAPVLAYWDAPHPLYVASPAELDDVFAAPVEDLRAPANRVTVGFRGYTGPGFWHQGYLIWGLTGGLIDNLLSHAGWEKDWEKGKVLDLSGLLAQSRNHEKRL